MTLEHGQKHIFLMLASVQITITSIIAIEKLHDRTKKESCQAERRKKQKEESHQIFHQNPDTESKRICPSEEEREGSAGVASSLQHPLSTLETPLLTTSLFSALKLLQFSSTFLPRVAPKEVSYKLWVLNI